MPVNDLLSGVRGRREEHLRMDNNYDQEWNTENRCKMLPVKIII